MRRKIIFQGIVVFVIVGAVVRWYLTRPALEQVHVSGQTMGTIAYNVKYLTEQPVNYKTQIDSLLVSFNQSLSTYIPTSEISQLNRQGVLEKPSSLMLNVLLASKRAFELSDGTFDPTVGPLVNSWGFGPNKQPRLLDSATVKGLVEKVGFQRVLFDEQKVQLDSGMYLDFSAIAKGYAVDLVGEWLESRGFTSYMVEIGGEVRARGTNMTGEIWKIGIEDPLVQRDEQKLMAVVQLKDRSMATSGNYRNYYQIGDRTVAHTIDPRTGFNTSHTLLSASVFAPDCMSADAFATAFMVLGVDSAKAVADRAGLEAFLIYQDEDSTIRAYVTPGLQAYVTSNAGQ